MAIKRKDIRDILANEELDTESKTKKLLDLIHEETDAVRDEKDSLQTKLDEANKALDKAKADKDKTEKDFNDYKASQSAKDTRSAKEKAYAQLLKEAGVGEKHVKLILKAADLDSLEIDGDGKFKKADDISKSIKTEYADYISTTHTSGASFDNPPAAQGGAKMSKADILKMTDTAARQKAIAENHELFGF